MFQETKKMKQIYLNEHYSKLRNKHKKQIQEKYQLVTFYVLIHAYFYFSTLCFKGNLICLF